MNSTFVMSGERSWTSGRMTSRRRIRGNTGLSSRRTATSFAWSTIQIAVGEALLVRRLDADLRSFWYRHPANCNTAIEEVMDEDELRRLYEGPFRGWVAEREEWKSGYVADVVRVREATASEWREADFQRYLWNELSVSGVGPGRAVNVDGAFEDVEVANLLLEVRDATLPSDLRDRARWIDEKYDAVLDAVQRHVKRNPRAKLLRLFAALRPREMTCLMSFPSIQAVRKALDLKKGALGQAGQHVIIRDAVERALGSAETDEDVVEQAIFSWFLAARELAESEVDDEAVEPASRDAVVTPLRLRPLASQGKGLNPIGGGFDTIVGILRAAEHGVFQAELVDELMELNSKINPRTASTYLYVARQIGVLEQRDGMLRPTARGLSLLEGDEASNVIAPILISRFLGFAQILRELEPHDEGLRKAKLYELLQGWHPGWTTTMMPSALVKWARECDLVEKAKDEDGYVVVRLTDNGRYWESTLPEDLEPWRSHELPDEDDADDVVEDELESERMAVALAPLTAVVPLFESDPELRDMIVSEATLRELHGAFHSSDHRRFVLLSGLSGTGKTSLARAYARAYCAALDLRFRSHFLCEAVRPDWTDPTGLLGFENVLQRSTDPYKTTPVLNFLLEASRDSSRPYFLCLDEMNLARVEHYFAPFLSAMEAGGGDLRIHGSGEAVGNIPATIPWPRNLFVVGTVNMDETTHPFSDKVLDRAFTIELWDVDLGAWEQRIRGRRPAETESALERVLPVLRDLHAALEPVRRHFGYRVCDEVLGYCVSIDGEAPTSSTLDAAVLAKVLTKIRGDDSGGLLDSIDACIESCGRHELPRSRRKLESMRSTLASHGICRFWS